MVNSASMQASLVFGSGVWTCQTCKGALQGSFRRSLQSLCNRRRPPGYLQRTCAHSGKRSAWQCTHVWSLRGPQAKGQANAGKFLYPEKAEVLRHLNLFAVQKPDTTTGAGMRLVSNCSWTAIVFIHKFLLWYQNLCAMDSILNYSIENELSTEK